MRDGKLFNVGFVVVFLVMEVVGLVSWVNLIDGLLVCLLEYVKKIVEVLNVLRDLVVGIEEI